MPELTRKVMLVELLIKRNRERKMEEFHVIIETLRDQIDFNITAENRFEAIQLVMNEHKVAIDSQASYEYGVIKASVCKKNVRGIKKHANPDYKEIHDEIPEFVYCPKCHKPIAKSDAFHAITCGFCGYNAEIKHFLQRPPSNEKGTSFDQWSEEDMIDFILDIESDKNVQELEEKSRDELRELCESL